MEDYEIRASEPKIERSGGTYTLTFELEGAMPLSDLERPLQMRGHRARLEGATAVIHDVQLGRGAEAVKAVKDAVAEVNDQRQRRREKAARGRAGREAGGRRAEEALERMREEVRGAWEAD